MIGSLNLFLANQIALNKSVKLDLISKRVIRSFFEVWVMTGYGELYKLEDRNNYFIWIFMVLKEYYDKRKKNYLVTNCICLEFYQ